ncbi:hypothetical protein [Haloferula sp. A504]|uniref:hypothetical protein n=1 Tax=Haloferula sp. A504 TaxID=3373601 RepID=UPI0031C9E63F|nr:hypothetical protein [Verrucomicrobiaceae bacterium E54]
MTPHGQLPDPASDRDELKRLTVEVLGHEGSYGILVGLVMELVEILDRSAGFRADPGGEVVEGGIRSGGGLAISPAQAALCADEPTRTAVFLRGVHDAISKAIATPRETQQAVQVLYAGSGPYATLGIPLMTLFPPEQVRFTILDLHPVSIQSVKAIVGRLGLGKSVASCVVADACRYVIPEGEIPAVIVSETMDAALGNEPQVAIMRHLLSQAPGARLVPESVQVDAFLLDTSREPERIEPDREDSIPASSPDRLPLGRVFTLDAPTIGKWTTLTGDRLPAATIEMPAAPGPHYEPYLFTTIVTHGNHILRTHDCGLTSPRAFPGEGKWATGDRIQFHYRLGTDPGLGWSPAGAPAVS